MYRCLECNSLNIEFLGNAADFPLAFRRIREFECIASRLQVASTTLPDATDNSRSHGLSLQALESTERGVRFIDSFTLICREHSAALVAAEFHLESC